MPSSFPRSTGAQRDLAELCYLSALHQTQKGDVRRDGSIRDVDVALFLRSRYGVIVDPAEVRRKILPGLAGTDETDEQDDEGGDGNEDGGHNDDGVVDLAELTSLILMPALVKLAQSEDGANTGSDGGDGFVKIDYEHDDNDVPDHDIIAQVLSIILRDIGHESSSSGEYPEYPELTPSLLETILRSYGEDHLAVDSKIIDQMMEAASEGQSQAGDSGRNGPVRLDPETFARALTADLSLLNPSDDDRISTNYEDVLSAGGDGAATADTTKNAPSDGEEREISVTDFKRFRFQTNHIDFAAGRFASKAIVFLLWASFTIFLFAELYLTREYSLANVDYLFVNCKYFRYDDDTFDDDQTLDDDAWYDYAVCQEDTFGQKIWKSIVIWLIRFAVYVVFGFGYIGLGGLGNSLERGRWCGRRITSIFGFLFTAGLAAGFFFWRIFDPQDDFSGAFWYSQYTYFILACFVLILHARNMLGSKASLPKVATSEVYSEQTMKQAAAYKTSLILKNALRLHCITDDDKGDDERQVSSLGAALLNLSVQGEEAEDVGGYFWCWKQFFSGELAQKEGILFSARILALQLVQGIIAIFLLLAGIFITQYVIEEWEYGKADPLAYTLEPLFNFFGINIDEGLNSLSRNEACSQLPDPSVCDEIASGTIREYLTKAANEVYPEEEYMIKAPMVVWTVIAFLYATSLFFVYIPSVCSTILKFRSGKLSFFDDNERFSAYRTRVDLQTLLLGTLFWSGIFGPLLIGAIFGFIVFLFLWQATRGWMLTVVASIIGVTITLILKQILAALFVTKEYHGFYRREVNKVNIYSLALESVTLGVGVLTAGIRAAKIIVVSVLYIGRIDTPLLSTDLNVGPLGDKHPIHFRKELLVQESHRHPLIEVLGKMYLMKYRYQSSFVNGAGYSYRLLFTLALMPWMRKYRLCNRKNTSSGDDGLGVNVVSALATTVKESVSVASRSTLRRRTPMSDSGSDES